MRPVNIPLSILLTIVSLFGSIFIVGGLILWENKRSRDRWDRVVHFLEKPEMQPLQPKNYDPAYGHLRSKVSSYPLIITSIEELRLDQTISNLLEKFEREIKQQMNEVDTIVKLLQHLDLYSLDKTHIGTCCAPSINFPQCYLFEVDC